MKQLLALLWLALLALAAPAAAQTFPKNNGSPVVDQAGILRPEQVIDLKSKAQALYAQSGRAFAVATVKSLEGYPVDDYAYRLGRDWKLGSAKGDDGVLLLVAPNERKVSIATGYGAGGYMTDAMSGIIIREAILPHFKQNPPDYGGGIEAGADAIIKQMSLPPNEAQARAAQADKAQQARRDQSPGILPVIFWMIIILFMISMFARRAGGRRHRRRRGWGGPIILWGPGSGGGGSWGGGGGSWGGGGGGSFGGFGGGSFGGGGASGSW
ncbi:TPM domain-containing protein [Sphingomonas hankyongi]|uniref:TPM domain-containing protein n=1 Tax=Sphingomonas hankyongi TaxID=2908209 RepID=A0ABT0S0Y3_9SPHN|nr:TPM domain-containing protein [Sphingomonas hankyongi]MCL6729517.1 TPM domain-containing protein [Sphingomonas hankyongi]